MAHPAFFTDGSAEMNEHFDLYGYLDGYRVSYRGHVIWEGRTWTGACRAMTAARAAYLALKTRKAA